MLVAAAAPRLLRLRSRGGACGRPLGCRPHLELLPELPLCLLRLADLLQGLGVRGRQRLRLGRLLLPGPQKETVCSFGAPLPPPSRSLAPPCPVPSAGWYLSSGSWGGMGRCWVDGTPGGRPDIESGSRWPDGSLPCVGSQDVVPLPPTPLPPCPASGPSPRAEL